MYHFGTVIKKKKTGLHCFLCLVTTKPYSVISCVNDYKVI